jgi:NADPH:quinone reductase-like Zn-dependent oxidoreductase
MISQDVVEWGKPLQQAVRETPTPHGTEVLVKVKYCGVCHSDVHIRDGYFDLGGGRKFQMSDRGMKPPVTRSLHLKCIASSSNFTTRPRPKFSRIE